jgi:hypothetical protein
MPFFLCCVHCCQLLPWYLAPLGYGLDMSGLDAGFLRWHWCHDPQGAIPIGTQPAHGLGHVFLAAHPYGPLAGKNSSMVFVPAREGDCLGGEIVIMVVNPEIKPT